MSGEPRGLLIAFEGLDQSGKQTQAERLQAAIEARGIAVSGATAVVYDTRIGGEIHGALHGTRDYEADVMQLLYVANRYEHKPRIEQWLSEGTTIVCDRYIASSVAYGEAHGLDPEWLADVQRYLPRPDLTILLDIAPETAAARKAANRDKYERDLALLARVRASYLRQAEQGWVRLDADRDRHAVAAEVEAAVSDRLGRV